MHERYECDGCSLPQDNRDILTNDLRLHTIYKCPAYSWDGMT